MESEQLKTFTREKSENESVNSDVKSGPDVSSIGFIPYYKSIKDVPRSNYTQHNLGLRSRVGFSLLFDSGNRPKMEQSFSGITGFMKRISSREFRGAMELRDVKLYCDSNNKPIKVSAMHFEEVGDTPIREQIIWRFIGKPKWNISHSLGRGSFGCTCKFNDESATITQWVRLMLGKKANFASWIVIGKWAPFAWMRTDYTIFSNGQVAIKFAGTYIPTQFYYVNWKVGGAHDMLANDLSQIDGFINAGDGNDAPGKYHYNWPPPTGI